MNIKGLIENFNKDDIRENYDNFIEFAYNLLIKNMELEVSFDDSQLDCLIDELIEVINEKIHNDIELNYMEVDIFLHSFICYVLEKLDIKNLIGYTYIEPDGKRLMDNWNGVCRHSGDGSYIYYNIDILREFGNLNINYDERLWSILTLAHELVHVKQEEDIKNGVISLDNYVITLERVLRLGDFYYENYTYVREEVDANNRAIDLLSAFYGEHNVYDEDVMIEFQKCMKIYAEYDIYSADNHNVMVDNIEQDISIYYSLYKTSESVKEKPELVDKYPLLSLVYNKDGSLYSIKELFLKRRAMLGNDLDILELNKVYEHILVSYQVFMDLNYILDEIREYLDSISYDDAFAMLMLEKLALSKEIITENDLNDKIKKRILNFGNSV